MLIWYRILIDKSISKLIGQLVTRPLITEEEDNTEPVDRLKAVFVFCGDEEYHTRIAALGAVAYLTSDIRICKCIVNIGSFEEIVKETICIEDPGENI